MRRMWVWCCAFLCGVGGCQAKSPADYVDSSPAAQTRGEPLSDNVLKVDPASPLRIMCIADLSLVTRDFAAAERELPRLAAEHGGFLGDVQVDRRQGTQRTGRWTARIPVARFDEFLERVSELGVPESRRQTAQDVTEEFVDLEARIANARQLEQRMVLLLESRTGALKDVIEVERELGRVREEIERLEGRRRYLNDRTQLTTVHIAVREQRDYVPPQAPTFPQQLADSWYGSLDQLRVLGEQTLIAVVAFLPWSWLAVPPLAFVWYRRTRGHSKAQPSAG